MQEIRKDGEVYYYGDDRCNGPDDAYSRLRADYHKSLGRNVHLRLNMLGKRKERIRGIHSFLADRDYAKRLEKEFGGSSPVPYRILGLVGVSYFRIFSGEDLQRFCDDDRFMRWVDYAFLKGSGAVRLIDRKNNSGRTSKLAHARYR